MPKNKIYKPKAISGFPELLPEYRAVELEWLDKIRKVFESYGFCSIETPAVEEVDALLAKGGDTEKEIYTLSRLHEDEGALADALTQQIDPARRRGRLALHFDLTVPMARYVAQHFNNLVFPFKRYQIQKVWRGERAQSGRSREFYQADIDIVNIDSLPIHFDAELPAVMYEAYQALDIPPVQMRISNRKIVCGYLNGLGIKDIPPVTRILDKLDKIGEEAVIKMLVEETGLTTDTAKKSVAITEIETHDNNFVELVKALGVKDKTLDEGLEELSFVIKNLSHLPKNAFKVDLSIIRGLDYYTGTVIEVYFQEFESSSIGGGGRYDDLAGSFINKKLPGIGISMGLTRIFYSLLDKGLIKAGSKSPAHVLVVLPSEDKRELATKTADTLRKRGFNVEMYHNATKVKKQIAYAEKKGINYVWFPPFEDGLEHEVKDLSLAEQYTTTPDRWKG